ncbi:GntR family transcriptional regulator [Angustibacter sp. McL0619]|uniref:GntR family transcriptional regulator n=1 Tax=Angustibacter sp. McL0619 TaxID=3415676 RepID=UPI003CE6B72B
MKSGDGRSDPPYLRVAAQLRASIAAGEFAVGSRLPAVTKLGEQFGVAAGTVRSALAVLAREGLVEVQHGRGTTVLDGGRDAVGGADLDELREQLVKLERRVKRLERRSGSGS